MLVYSARNLYNKSIGQINNLVISVNNIIDDFDKNNNIIIYLRRIFTKNDFRNRSNNYAVVEGTSGLEIDPRIKAVVPGKYRESISEMYFCANTSSKFSAKISKNSKASVYFYSRKLIWKGCMFKGKMEIVSDLTFKEKYWQNKFKNAYPKKSYTDLNFCVLKFTPETGRFYSWSKPEDFEI